MSHSMVGGFLQLPCKPSNNPATSWGEWRSSYLIHEEVCEYKSKPNVACKALLFHVLGPTSTEDLPNIAKALPTARDTAQFDKVTCILNNSDALYKSYKNVMQATAIFNFVTQQVGAVCQ